MTYGKYHIPVYEEHLLIVDNKNVVQELPGAMRSCIAVTIAPIFYSGCLLYPFAQFGLKVHHGTRSLNSKSKTEAMYFPSHSNLKKEIPKELVDGSHDILGGRLVLMPAAHKPYHQLVLMSAAKSGDDALEVKRYGLYRRLK